MCLEKVVSKTFFFLYQLAKGYVPSTCVVARSKSINFASKTIGRCCSDRDHCELLVCTTCCRKNRTRGTLCVGILTKIIEKKYTRVRGIREHIFFFGQSLYFPNNGSNNDASSSAQRATGFGNERVNAKWPACYEEESPRSKNSANPE